MSGIIPFGVYVHFPFCRSKCPYCDFNSVAAKSIDNAALKKAYAESLSFYAGHTAQKRVTSIFFGGGTPSLADVDVVASVIDRVKTLWDVAPDAEVSLEGNPDSLTPVKMRELKDAGVNRLSIGVQSLSDAELRFLGRIHTADAARHVLVEAKKTFKNLSADFMYTFPSQTMEDWEKTLAEALSFSLPHLSLYQLSLEEGSTFERQKKVVLPAEEISAAFFDMTDRVMTNAGYTHYEISNFARSKNDECRHNLIYWQGGDYIGVGAGACGRFEKDGVFYATETTRNPQKWLESPTTDDWETVTVDQRAVELLMMGLRVQAGVDRKRFKAMLNADVVDFINARALQQSIDDGFLNVDDDAIYVTPAGRMILNKLLVALI